MSPLLAKNLAALDGAISETTYLLRRNGRVEVRQAHLDDAVCVATSLSGDAHRENHTRLSLALRGLGCALVVLARAHEWIEFAREHGLPCVEGGATEGALLNVRVMQEVVRGEARQAANGLPAELTESAQEAA